MENTDSLSVSARAEFGKGPSRRLRAAGLVPGVCYGATLEEPIHVAVDPKQLRRRLTGPYGLNALFKLQIEGSEANPTVRVNQYQRDPLHRTIVHVDFQALDLDTKVTVNVPLMLVGKAVGIANGGRLRQLQWTVKVRATPDLIPTHLDVDVSDLEVNQMRGVTQIPVPGGMELIYNNDYGVATVIIPRGAVSEETEEEGEEEVEEEVEEA